MKVAVATDDSEVAVHFGRCQQYTVVDIDNDKVVNTEIIDSPGHRPGFLPDFLARRGVDCVIAGGMGPRAQNLFAERGIKVVVGATGAVDRVVCDYVIGELETGGDLCDHPRDDLGC